MKNIYLILAALFLLSSFAQANESSPQKIVEDIFAKAAQEAVSNDKALQASISQKVDFVAMASAVLGGEKKKITAQEFDWFRSTLQEIITRTVYPNAPGFLTGVKISYKDMEEKTGAALVKSSVQNKADITEVNYKLAKDSSGEWKVVDVSLDGESWVESIKDQVAETLKKKKWAGLKKQLNDRLQKLKEGKSKEA